jgi:8-hydroxy-5-deazaflavin:NADPH oxidoreductase
MRIGILGAGRIGGTLGRLWIDAGHDVLVSSRHPEAITELPAGKPRRAADFGELVLLAVPWASVTETADEVAPAVAGKIVVDATNPYGPEGPVDLGGEGSSEVVAGRLLATRLVKCFNTIQWARLRDEGRPEGDPRRLAVFVAGDDDAAKDTVARLASDAGFDAVDAGSLRDGRRLEPGSPVFTVPLTAAEARDRLAAG